MTTPTTVQVQIQLRADTAANWASENPTLLANEVGRETDTGKIKIGDGTTAWNTLAYQPFGAQITDADIAANAEIAVSKLADGAARQLLQTDAAGTGVEWTDNVDVPGTLDVTGAATFDDDVTIEGDLTVNGTTTTIDTETLLVKDKNIELAVVETPTDTTADGGGITLKGATDKTINWIDATDAWTSSERFSYPLGSAAAPALTFTGDPNTGIYSPGADQVAISTGGTGRLFVDASGNVGVGGNPLANVHVQTAAGTASQLRVTTGSNASSATLRLGQVGAVFWDQQVTTTDGHFLLKVDGGNDAYKVERASLNANTHIFTTGASERLRITSDGKLGLGTSSPGAAFHIAGALPEIRFTDTDSGNPDHLLSGSAGNFVISVDANNEVAASTFRVSVDGGEKFRIDSSGNVGIGTTAPAYALDVNSGGTNVAARFESTDPSMRILLKDDGANGVYLHSTNNELAFETNGTNERVRIDSSGRLLVGTSSAFASVSADGTSITPLIQVAAEGGVRSDLLITSFRSNNGVFPQLLLQKARNTFASPSVVVSGDTLGSINFTGYDSAAYQLGALIKAEVDGTPGTNDMPGRLVFSTTPDGSATPVERMRISQDGTLQHFTDGTAVFRNSGTSAGSYALSVANGATSISTGTVVFRVAEDGDCENTNNSYGAISDIKLKENIVDANSQWDDLKALQVRNYNFKAETGYGTHTQIGLVAQEVELVSPGLVSESPDLDEDGNDLGTVTKSVNYSVLYMKAVKALQEAMERIEVLEAKVNALEGN